MEQDEKHLRQEELKEQRKNRRATNLIALIGLGIALGVQAWALNQANDTYEQTSELADRSAASQQTQYLRTQQRVGYRTLLGAARDEAAVALRVQRGLEDGGNVASAAELQMVFDSCRRAVTDVVLLGPASIQDQAEKIGGRCFKLNRSLKDRLSNVADSETAQDVDDRRRRLIAANDKFLDDARGVIQGKDE